MKPINTIILCVLLSLFSLFPSRARLPGTMKHPESIPLSGSSQTDRLDRAVFLGESTTTHLRSRGGLREDQVWANSSGTMKLDSGLLSRPILDSRTGESLTIPQAAERYRPETLVLSFGLNGVTGFIQNKDLYLGNYQKLIERIRQASPTTRIVVQSVYPVASAEHHAEWNFSVPPEQINEYLRTLNCWLEEFCQGLPDVRFADTASVLRDSGGYLRSDFTTDGIHLTESAYCEILRVLRECL